MRSPLSAQESHSDLVRNRRSHDALLQAVQDLQISLQLDTAHSWFQAPIRFEDALGQVIPFPSECDFHVWIRYFCVLSTLTCFQDLQRLISSRFEPREGGQSRPGYHKVQSQEFELFDSANSRCVVTESNFDLLVPGMGITMAFTVGQYVIKPENYPCCPRPGCGSRASKSHRSGGRVWYVGEEDLALTTNS